MKAVDTNVLLRWITGDDPIHSPIAERSLTQPVFVSLTVLLEVAWVLGSAYYRYDRASIATALRLLVATATIRLQREDDVVWAIDRFEAGADIADMIHIVACRGSDAFVTFEKRLAALAGPDTPLSVERPV